MLEKEGYNPEEEKEDSSNEETPEELESDKVVDFTSAREAIESKRAGVETERQRARAEALVSINNLRERMSSLRGRVEEHLENISSGNLAQYRSSKDTVLAGMQEYQDALLEEIDATSTLEELQALISGNSEYISSMQASLDQEERQISGGVIARDLEELPESLRNEIKFQQESRDKIHSQLEQKANLLRERLADLSGRVRYDQHDMLLSALNRAKDLIEKNKMLPVQHSIGNEEELSGLLDSIERRIGQLGG